MLVSRLRRRPDLSTAPCSASPPCAEALAALGGGIRGLFRVDRAWRPRTSVPVKGVVLPPAPASQAAASGSGGWTGAAAAPQPGPGQQAAAAGSQSSGITALPNGWAVMGGRRAAKPQPLGRAGAQGQGVNMLAMLDDQQLSDVSDDE